MPNKPILCLDFDGVIHSYASGWKGVDVIPDPPTEGFFEWAIEAAKLFTLQIYSSRSSRDEGLAAIREWLSKHWVRSGRGSTAYDENLPGWLQFHKPTAQGKRTLVFELLISPTKPAAFLTIDDRAWQFDGTWPDPQRLLAFKTWQQMTSEDYAAERGWSQKHSGDEKQPGDVVLRMTLDDWQTLLMMLGAAMTTCPDDPFLKGARRAFFNRLNRGNPAWTPY